MSAAPTGTVEREIKLGARPGFAMPDLAETLPGVTVVAEPALDLDATYVDTPDLQLVRHGVSLRRRTGEGEPRWTLKLPSGRQGAALLRREIDVIDSGQEVPAQLADLVTGWVRTAPLGPVIVIRSHRERLRLIDGDGRLLAEIDDDEVAVIDGGAVAARFREVEVEMGEHGTPELLHGVSDALVAAGAGAPDPTSKVTRALGPRALVPPDLTPTILTPDATVAEVVQTSLREAVGQIVAHDHVIRLDDDPEGVHQARVGIRRLRSAVRVLAPVLHVPLAAGWEPELHRLADALGAVRDTDVLLARLGRAAEGLPPEDHEPAGVVLRGAERQRREQMAIIRSVLGGPQYVTLLDDLVATALRPAVDGDGTRPAAEVLPELVRPTWRRLRRAVEALGPDPDDEALHGVRLLAKRARYASELAALVVGGEADDLATALADLQDVLGDLRDAVLAEAWLRRAARVLGPAERFAAGELVALERLDAADRRSAFLPAWEACDRKALTRWLR